MSTILSIAPYKFLPPENGGHLGVLIVEKLLCIHNKVNTISTTDNIYNKPTPFVPHFIISNSKLRYLPFNQFKKVFNVAKKIKPDYIFCHHHYLFPLANKIAKRLHIPLYIRSYNIESERFKNLDKWWWKVMFRFEKYSFKNSEKIFFITREDRDWAVEHYCIPQENAIVMPFGMDFSNTPEVSPNSKIKIAKQYQLNAELPWLFFMGQLNYGPNEEAVRFLIQDIVPLLKKKIGNFHLLICGKGLSEELQQEIKNIQNQKEVLYLGFVPEIEPVIASCNLMLNPVISGGGVKTKVIESLAWNKTVVSTYSGAIGIEQSVCDNKLLIAPDKDWEQFTDLVKQGLMHKESNIPMHFFDYYYAKNIADRMQQYFE